MLLPTKTGSISSGRTNYIFYPAPKPAIIFFNIQILFAQTPPPACFRLTAQVVGGQVG
jgi:hypothetical protein